MVSEVTAFRAEDGSIYPTKLAALEHDALARLKTLDQFNHASARALIIQCEAVVDILAPIVAELHEMSLNTAAAA